MWAHMDIAGWLVIVFAIKLNMVYCWTDEVKQTAFAFLWSITLTFSLLVMYKLLVCQIDHST